MSTNGSKAWQQSHLVPKIKPLYIWLIAGAVFIGFFFYLFHPILAPFVVAVIVAYALHPAVCFFERKGLGRTTATAILVLSVLILLATFLFFTLPFLKAELQVLAHKLPTYIENFLAYITPVLQKFMHTFQGKWQQEIQSTLTEHLSNILAWFFSFISGLFTNALALANLASLVLLTPLLVFYILRDWNKILEFCHQLIPTKVKASVVSLGENINTTLSSYFRGQASVCLVLIVYFLIGLNSMHLDFAFSLAVLSGSLAFIPYIGFLIGVAAALSVAIAQFGFTLPVLIISGIYLAGHLLESFYLTPKLIGGNVGLHPVWVIFSLLGGGYVVGFTGLLLAVPLAAVFGVLCRFALTRYRETLKASLPQSRKT
jgi:predicted PurR-regulated permease PerM